MSFICHIHNYTFTFTFMHLADAFIQSDLQLHSGYTFLLVHVFPGNRTHNLSLSWHNVLPLSHTGTQSIMRSEMCSSGLEQWAADCAAPGEQSWTSCRSRDSNPLPWVTSGFKSNALSIWPTTARKTISMKSTNLSRLFGGGKYSLCTSTHKEHYLANQIF